MVILPVILTQASGCGLTPVQVESDDTYHVEYSSGMGAANETDEKNKAIKAAADYCTARGKHMRVIDASSRPGGLRFSYGKVHFACDDASLTPRS